MQTGIDCCGKIWREVPLGKRETKNITGQTFGMLTAMFPVELIDDEGNCVPRNARGYVPWLFQCSCGNCVVKRKRSVCVGDALSCGCSSSRLRSEKTRKNFDIGERIGSRTIIDYVQKPGKKGGWLVRCDCGKENVVSGYWLRSGRSQSCGCRLGEIVAERQFINLIGQRRGMLTITGGPFPRFVNETHWIAQCDCGKTTEVNGQAFRRGEATSCGCMNNSSGEALIASMLNDAKCKYHQEYTFDDLVGDKGARLRYDFAIVNNEDEVIRLIEFDGKQHFKPSSSFGGEQRFIQQQRYDHLKDEYAKNHNIPLVRIPYNKQSALCLDDLFSEEFLVA